ncbi:cysteine--tRNA ligase [Candidatus Micrarchaeota archaeon]|nr:cysteine--tRNA ligase [Candidatus Micrarchaeota archaeon]
MVLKVYNTLGRKIEEFKPLEEGEVKMYVCGLTPYDKMHIGHARTYVAFDVIKRYLRFKGFSVKSVQNVTDIDDKIIKRANERKEDALKLSSRFSEQSLKEMEALGITKADFYPKVSEHIPEIIAIVKKLEENGFAYATSSGVYYDVSKFEEYGKLSGQNLEQIKSGARVEVDEEKKHPADFALWKKAKPGEIKFASPWGDGRPGWHIECSAMSSKYLGKTFDIHGGAVDLIFPHHENEIAQSEAANGVEFVKHWLHTGWLTIKKEKMSKSLKNFITVEEALEKHEPEAMRLFFVSTHYRSPIDFNEQSLVEAKASLDHLHNTLAKAQNAKQTTSEKNEKFTLAIAKLEKQFTEAMDNDFDSSSALASLFEIAKTINAYIDAGEINENELDDAVETFLKLAEVFGLLEKQAEASTGELEKIKQLASEVNAESKGSIEEIMQGIIKEREEARSKKDYKKSDLIRTKLSEAGITLEDGKQGAAWKRKK